MDEAPGPASVVSAWMIGGPSIGSDSETREVGGDKAMLPDFLSPTGPALGASSMGNGLSFRMDEPWGSGQWPPPTRSIARPDEQQ